VGIEWAAGERHKLKERVLTWHELQCVACLAASPHRCLVAPSLAKMQALTLTSLASVRAPHAHAGRPAEAAPLRLALPQRAVRCRAVAADQAAKAGRWERGG
jgi:hypothetical protein